MSNLSNKLPTSVLFKTFLGFAIILLGYVPLKAVAGDKVRFSHKSRTHVTSGYNSLRYHSRKKQVYSQKFRSMRPRGPQVINVRKALAKKRLRISVHQNANRPSNINRHVIDTYSGEPRALYYDQSKCEGGYECVIRLGNKSSSPKVIVIGEKQIRRSNDPIVVYPPS